MNSKADGLYYRLGNSILEKLRKSEHPKEQNKLATSLDKTNYKPKDSLKHMLNQGHYQLKRLEYAIDSSFEDYQLEQERLKVDRAINQAKWE